MQAHDYTPPALVLKPRAHLTRYHGVFRQHDAPPHAGISGTNAKIRARPRKRGKTILGLTRFRGHLNLIGEGVHNAKNKKTLST